MKPDTNDAVALFNWVVDGLEAATETGDGAFRHFALATNGLDGAPAVRTVVLRSVEEDLSALTVFTDGRTEKIREINADSHASAMFYDPDAQVQVRVTGRATIVSEGPEVDAAWDATPLPSRKSYMTIAAPATALASPSSGLPDGLDGRVPTEAESVAGRAHFTLIRLAPTRVEIVVLDRDGNRGLSATRNDTGVWQFLWRVP